MSARALIFVFPGQSSRDALMFERLARVDRSAAECAHAAFVEHVGQPFKAAFASNHEIQLAVFEVTQAWLSLARAAGLHETASAGSSLGEYSHLVSIDALDVAGARALVAARGRCYDDGPSGMMAALFPLALAQVRAICAQVQGETGDPHAVDVANINSATQTVIAGSADAVERALALAEEQHYISGQVIERRIPMHVRRFAPVAESLRPALERAPWRTPRADYWPNVEARARANARPADFVDCLSRHVYSPVRWFDTIEVLSAQYGEPVFVEVGPLQVLTRLMIRRWINPKRVFALDLAHAGAAAFGAHIGEIRRALVSD